MRSQCDSGLALVLSGGGARAAYQVGLLRHLGRRYPNLAPGILTGVSAGAILATDLAARQDTFGSCVDGLYDVWHNLRMTDVFDVGSLNLASRAFRWGLRLVSGGVAGLPRPDSLVDTTPLTRLLAKALQPAADGTFPGIARNLAAHHLDAIALTASSYSTGESVTWVESRDARGVLTKGGKDRQQATHCLALDHVMASSALPFFFPASQVDGEWYGDGGIRLTAPLSPAVRLGARRIVVVSTRHLGRRDPGTHAGEYPPPVQVAGMLLNAVFLDQLDSDALRLEQVNSLLDRIPPERRDGLRHIELLVIRPSQDLGHMADAFEPELPRALRFMVRGLGSRETRSNDLLSLLMFQPDYLSCLLELGEADARARANEIDAFLKVDSAEV